MKIWINDQQIKVNKEETILEVANRKGIYIPHLCYHPCLRPIGSCRLCAVEVQGYRGLLAACSTPVEDGMRIYTDTPRVMEFRRQMLKLILQKHPTECVGCYKNGKCELQRLVSYVGIDAQYPAPIKEDQIKKVGAYFERDLSLCINCGRCVRVCHEIRGAKVIVFREVENSLEVSTPFDQSFEEAGCQFCGTCLDVCPVSALRESQKGPSLEGVGKVPENLTKIINDLYFKQIQIISKTSICPICDAGCELIFELTEAKDIFQIHRKDNFLENGIGCVEGRFLLKGYLSNQKRIKRPLIKKDGILKEESWEYVLEVLAKRLSSYKPEEVAILTDGRLTDEELCLIKKFAQAVLKTDSIGYIAPEGHLISGQLIQNSLGTISANEALRKMEESDCILAIGVNPVASYPVAEAFIRMAVLKGAKLIVISPYKINITKYCDIYLPCLPGKETTLIAGILRALLQDNNTTLTDEKLTPYDIEYVSKATHIPADLLEDGISIISKSNKLYLLYGLGIVEGDDPLETTKAIVKLSLIKKATVVPLYGLGNYSEICRLGFLNNEFLRSKKIKAIYLVGENLRGDKLPESIKDFIRKAEFVVMHDIKYPDPDIDADIILPMAGVLEKGGKFAQKEIKPVLDPPKEARSVIWLLTELAKKMGRTLTIKESNTGQKHLKTIDWIPPKIEDIKTNKDYPFIVVSKERIKPYFKGPLLPKEYLLSSDSNTQVEINPSDGFTSGFLPDELIKLITPEAEWKAKIKMNPSVPSGMLVVSEDIKADGLLARIEKL